MQADFISQQPSTKDHKNRVKRAVGTAVGSLVAVGVSLAFACLMGSQDARWAQAWIGLGHAYSLFG